MKKITKIIITAAVISTMNVSALAAELPREAAPVMATEESIIITENLIGNVLTEVQGGLGFGEANAKANNLIRTAVIEGKTNGNGFGMLSAISANSISQYRDMYLRPEYYKQIEEEIKIVIADVITKYANCEVDYITAVKEAYEKIYQTVNPTFDYEEQLNLDTCYRDIPAVNNAKFTVARKLLLEARRQIE
ncbi:MAG: hypothetical protein J5981_02040 [Lachnospira sp.]|nr:hypothetical protein [Lachnospira sp.]